MSTVDLTSAAGTSVDIDDDLPTAGNPLTADEVASLRHQADPDRLRCAPRGCAAWRFAHGGVPAGAGAVPLADDLVLILSSDHAAHGEAGGAAGGAANDPGDATRARAEHHLVAIDTATGRPRWATPLDDVAPAAATARTRLRAGPVGAMVLSGAAITAIAPDGEVVWRHDVGDIDGEVWDAVESSGVLLARGSRLGGSEVHHSLMALDVDGGDLLWSANLPEVIVMDEDILIAVDDRQRLWSLDHATGEARWSSRGLGGEVWFDPASGWLMAQGPRNTTVIRDPATGREVASIEGRLVSGLTTAGERRIGVTVDTRAWTDSPRMSSEVGSLEVVALDPDGRLVWTAELGAHAPWWTCCGVRIEDDLVTIQGPADQWVYTLADGALLASEDPTGDPPPSEWTWRPTEDLVVAWHLDGRGLDVRGPGAEVTIRGGRDISVESWEPLIVRDDHELMGIQPPPDR